MSNKKNSFREIKKNINYSSSKHIGKIIWNSELKQEDQLKMSDYIHYIKSTDIYNEFNNKINIDLNDYINYKILGICALNNLKMINNDQEFMFLITDKYYKLLFITIGKCHPLFWYKFTNKVTFINNFDTLYETYNPNQITNNFTNSINGFIGNEEILSLNIHDIEKHLILNKYTDKLIWGSNWVEHPFRSEYMGKNITHIDSIIYTGQAMRQNGDLEYCINVRTNYSKSIITIHCYEDAFILELKYNTIDTNQIESINDIFGRKYKTNIPIDIIMTLINFPFVTHMDILQMKPLNMFHFYVITLLVNEQKIFDDILPQFDIILNDKTGNYDDELKEYIKDFVQKNNSDKMLTRIINEINIYEIIESVTDQNDINLSINNIMDKYECINDDYIKNELLILFYNGFELINKFSE